MQCRDADSDDKPDSRNPDDKPVLYFTNFDMLNTVSPVRVDILQEMLTEAEYDKIKAAKLISGFKHGFSLGYEGPANVQLTSPNLKVNVGDEVDLWNKVMKEVRLKPYAGPFSEIPFRNFIQSPICLVPKDGGKDTRLIFHLSYPKGGTTSVNSNTLKEKCKIKYPDFNDAVKMCVREGVGCHLSKSDMSAAFRNLGILRRHWKYLCMKARSPLDSKWYYFFDKCLPFGSGISCKHFQDFSDCVAYLVQWRAKLGKKVTNYLDDYLFCAPLKLACDLQCKTFLEICGEINFPISMDKTFWSSTRMVFLGFMIDTVNQIVCIPLEKISKGVNMITYLLGKRSMTVLQLQQLCGYLNFLSRCIVPGRTFTRRLYSYIDPKLKSHHHIRISEEIKLDLNVWLQFLKMPEAFARPFIDFTAISAVDLDFYTDAMKNVDLGFGGYFGSSYMFSKWDKKFVSEKKSEHCLFGTFCCLSCPHSLDG